MEQQLERGRARLAELLQVLVAPAQTLLLQERAVRVGIGAEPLAFGLRCLLLGPFACPGGVVGRSGGAQTIGEREAAAETQVIPARLGKRSLRRVCHRACASGEPGEVAAAPVVAAARRLLQ